MSEQKQSCGICGGEMVLIRGRYPNQEKRPVCPTCCAERLDQIREISDKDYGKVYQAIEMPKLDLSSGGRE